MAGTDAISAEKPSNVTAKAMSSRANPTGMAMPLPSTTAWEMTIAAAYRCESGEDADGHQHEEFRSDDRTQGAARRAERPSGRRTSASQISLIAASGSA